MSALVITFLEKLYLFKLLSHNSSSSSKND